MKYLKYDNLNDSFGYIRYNEKNPREIPYTIRIQAGYSDCKKTFQTDLKKENATNRSYELKIV